MATTSYGQFKTENNTILNYVPDSVLNKFGNKLSEQELCEEIRHALSDLEEGLVCYPMYLRQVYDLPWINETTEKSLEIKFNIHAPYYSYSSIWIGDTSLIGYDLVMLNHIKEKYGLGFISEQIQRGKHLDSLGLGFKKEEILNDSDIFCSLDSLHHPSDSLHHGYKYVVQYNREINVEEILYLEYSAKEKSYMKIDFEPKEKQYWNLIIGKMIEVNPAQLEGKNIPFHLYLNLYYHQGQVMFNTELM